MNAWRVELRGSLAGREAFIAVAMNNERTGKMAANQPPGIMQALSAAYWIIWVQNTKVARCLLQEGQSSRNCFD
jgi:hypothetical protein